MPDGVRPCATLGAVARGDGRLSHDLLPGEKGPQDACGIFGVWAPGEEVAKLTYYGLYALQHRGQESAGMAVSNGSQILVYKDMGLVAQVFDETSLESLKGHIAVGHCRYSTTGGSTWENAQPTLGATSGGTVALGHNGNLTNSLELRDLVAERYGAAASGELSRGNTTDTALVTALLAGDADHTLEATALEVLPHLRGAFSFVFMDENTLYAARDPHGVRPLVLGRLDRGWVVASETSALDIVGASLVREIEPGELVVIDFGCIVDGYCSDMTRTVSVGDPGPEARRVWDVVRDSQWAGREAVRAGVDCAAVDRACREVIAAAGWADSFVHGTGHGVGLEIHEEPRVAASARDTLEPGSVVTVEPGVYLPGVGGVRIEDTVVVTPDGSDPLTAFPKHLII